MGALWLKAQAVVDMDVPMSEKRGCNVGKSMLLSTSEKQVYTHKRRMR